MPTRVISVDCALDALRSFSHCRIEVKAIEIHHLGPGGHEVVDELLLRIVAGVDFRNGPKLRVRTEDEIDSASVSMRSAIV